MLECPHRIRIRPCRKKYNISYSLVEKIRESGWMVKNQNNKDTKFTTANYLNFNYSGNGWTMDGKELKKSKINQVKVFLNPHISRNKYNQRENIYYGQTKRSVLLLSQTRHNFITSVYLENNSKKYSKRIPELLKSK